MLAEYWYLKVENTNRAIFLGVGVAMYIELHCIVYTVL